MHMKISNGVNKFLFFLKRPKVIVVAGRGKETAKEAISQVLNRYFKVGREVIIYDGGLEESKFFLKKSQLPILVATHVGEYHPDREFFAGDIKETEDILALAKELPAFAYLVLNFDDETTREIKEKSPAHPLTFGFGVRADVRATDVVLTQALLYGTNFKIDYQGKIVPVWLGKIFGKENIYAALAAVAVGEVLGLNLVEVSESLKSYQGVKGRLRLIDGIKSSLILDDSENASPLSMLEALEVLRKVEVRGRKIAVLGDILGIGKYAIEAHEALGEKVKNSADLLFAVGERAKFFAEGAESQGMPVEKIFQFNESQEAGLALQNEIKEGDFILVDGSQEMQMARIVEEIRA